LNLVIDDPNPSIIGFQMYNDPQEQKCLVGMKSHLL